MYKSPIEIIYGQAKMQIEGDIYKAVQSYDIMVDKDELLRALQYDRGQYDKGYADGRTDAMADLVRCKDCRWFDKTGFEEDNAHEEDLSLHTGWCKSWRKGTQACVFCSYGERRTDA